MLRPSPGGLAGTSDTLAAVLGYLNFSSGTFDPTVWKGMSDLFAAVEPEGERADAAALVARLLAERVAVLASNEPAFRDSRQATAVINLVFERVLAAYRDFHRDLLEHQPPGAIERPFFVMAAVQAVLEAGGPWDEVDRIEAAAVSRLNDYVGWRPVAVLENNRLSEPYPHEKVRPIPLYIAGAGAAHGRYRDLVAGAIAILEKAPKELATQADFELELLQELAIDPRAFDFLHPAASRPNYLFGLWDPSHIDEKGRYRRMVVQQATLNGILSWSSGAGAASADAGVDPEQFAVEASAVLAGVMLMAAGLSGHGPGAYQAAMPLAELLPKIAGYRDAFYRWLLAQLPQPHRERLEAEVQRYRQPFGGVRRHINSLLAGRRARQVESVALASVLARLGRSEAAERMAGMVPAASARMMSRVMSRVVAANRERSQDGTHAIDLLDEATDLLFRAVGCGATVDPWNILGLGGQFPLHEPGGESLPDPRVDDLVAMTEAILEGYAAVWRSAALGGSATVASRASSALERLAAWWDRHGSLEVSGVPHLSGREVFDSTREVIGSLERRRTTADSPPPGFWRKEVSLFTSPRSHADAVDALIDENDIDGAMGLVVHWASLLEENLLEDSGEAWLRAASRWLVRVRSAGGPAMRSKERRFLELVEANTQGFTDRIEAAATASFQHDPRRSNSPTEEDEPADDASGEESVAAAYESMVWHDSADDGTDGGLADVEGSGRPGDESGEQLESIEDAADFLAGVAGLVRGTVSGWCRVTAERPEGQASKLPSKESESLQAEVDSAAGWRHSLRRLRRGFMRASLAIASGASRPLPGTSPSEYDRARMARDSAAERLVDAAVQVTETLWALAARLETARGEEAASRSPVGLLFAAMLAGDVDRTKAALEVVKSRLAGRHVLYVPLSRGGRPDRIVRARSRERLLERIGAALPRLGLVDETIAIVNLAKSLESRRPKGAASVSEFDRLFEASTTSLVERIVESARDGAAPPGEVTTRVLEGLSLLVPRLLETWMTHARQLRLSVLERVRDEKSFETIREFIERYGNGLFTQHVLSPGSLRGILRGGVRRWLEELVERSEESPDGGGTHALVSDITRGVITPRQAAARLRFVFESVAENHAEYRDWNSTTSQSDRGECLHILLDFLRLKAEYDRISWTLRPVNMAHRVLARRGETEAARAWRQRMREETEATHHSLLDRLASMERTHGIRLASVADRVGRPFASVLEQDELEALVGPAVGELGSGGAAGLALERAAEGFLGVAPGSGVEVPEWLERLDRCVRAAVEETGDFGIDGGRLTDVVPWRPMSWEELSSRFLQRPQQPPVIE